MTKAKEYMACRHANMTYQQIADRYGVSKQAVHSTIKQYDKRQSHTKQETVVFPGLRRWMNQNFVTVTELESKTGLKLRYALRNGRINNEKIAVIIKVTGLSYQEAFERRAMP